MNNNDIDTLLYKLRNQMDKGFEDKELSFLLSNDLCSLILNKEFSLNVDNLSDYLIRKIVCDFYAYFIYKIELGDSIDDFVLEIIQDIKSIDSDDVINYVKYDLYKFYNIVKYYFEFCEQDIIFKEETMANIVNKRLGFEATSIYRDYFCSDLNYEDLLLSNNVIIGLDLVDYINKKNNDHDILEYINIEFDDKIMKNKFLNYILSNVYAYLKLNGCKDDFEFKLVNLTEKINNRMKCFYDDDQYVIELIKKYYNIYSGTKWFEFKDVRDYIPYSHIDLIYELDDSYKHPDDIIKNASDIFTLLENVQQFLFDNIENLTLKGKDDFEIVDWIKQLLNNEVLIYYDNNSIFNFDDDYYFRDLLKLFILSSFYEYCNYSLNEISFDEMKIFNILDGNINIKDAIVLYDDDYNCDVIISNYLNYFFSKEKIELLARRKIIQDNKFKKILNFNPYVYLDYRREIGSLFPFETSKSTEYGNVILGSLFDIVSLYENIDDQCCIKYEDVAQMFKNDFLSINFDLDEITGFILTNIYENIINKKELNSLEKDFIINMENKEINLYDIYNNDSIFGQFLLYFINLNGDYFNDNKLRELRKSGGIRKQKILKKYDPFYEVDIEILK